MKKILKLVDLRRQPRDGEQGQIVILAALTAVVVLAFAALAIDVGQFLHTRTNLQADVDAMALGGAQKLCGTATCSTTAISWANDLRGPNDVTSAEAAARVSTDCDGNPIEDNDKITATATRNNSSFLAQIVGFTGADIYACATAGKFALGGAAGLVPFGIEEQCLGNADVGESYTLKFDSDTEVANGLCDSGKGNYAALGIDASGAGPGCSSGAGTDDELQFKRAICFGANRGICAVSVISCNGEADDDNCASAPVPAYQICTEPGNMTGPIKDGVSFRMSNTSTQCDTWEEVVDADTDSLLPICDPWVPGGPSSLRVIMIPVVTGLWGDGGTHKVTVVSFAVFFLETFVEKDCKGSDCDIRGRFIKTTMHTGGLGYAELDEDSAVTVIKLIQ